MEEGMLSALRQQGAEVEVGLDGVTLSLLGPRLSRLEDVLTLLPIVTVCALPVLGAHAARADYSGLNVSAMVALLGGFWVGVMVLLYTLPAAARSRSRAVVQVTEQAVRYREQRIPLETLRGIFVVRQRALLMVDGQETPALIIPSDDATLHALQDLLYALSRRRREALQAAGYDLSQEGRAPQALLALRQVVP